jgi:hypothetical protein
MAPVWLTVVAWLYLSVCFCCAGIIAYDVVRAVPGTAPPHAQLGRLLAPHAGRHDHRILHLLARKRLASQPRHQGAHVSHRPGCTGTGCLDYNTYRGSALHFAASPVARFGSCN